MKAINVRIHNEDVEVLQKIAKEKINEIAECVGEIFAANGSKPDEVYSECKEAFSAIHAVKVLNRLIESCEEIDENEQPY